MSEEKTDKVGIAGLPKPWAVAVQLVGTFGLAVFLVLYYLFVLRPAEDTRYEKLSNSVGDLVEIVRAGQSLVTREQAKLLEELFIEAAAPKVVRIIINGRERAHGEAELAKKIEDELMLLNDRLSGLRREDGGVLSEQLLHKLRNAEVPQNLAASAKTYWKDLSSGELTLAVKELLNSRIRAAARAK